MIVKLLYKNGKEEYKNFPWLKNYRLHIQLWKPMPFQGSYDPKVDPATSESQTSVFEYTGQLDFKHYPIYKEIS